MGFSPLLRLLDSHQLLKVQSFTFIYTKTYSQLRSFKLRVFMTFFHPSQNLFFSTLLLGSLITLSASSWLTAWIGLELNLLSFIPLISPKFNLYHAEAALKYFLSQVLGSILILGRATWTLFRPLFTLPILLALLLKLGAAPFHFWLPSVREGVSWPHCIILLTIQKLAPISLIPWATVTYTSYFVIIWRSILSSLVGALGGFNQNLARKILAFSSINHLAWLLAALIFCEKLWLIYFSSYCVVSWSVIFILHDQQIFHLSQTQTIFSKSSPLKLFSILSFLSLGGLPPFLGFLPKWIVIFTLTKYKAFFWVLILIITTLITLFFYLRFLIDSILILSPKFRSQPSQPSKFILSSLFFVNTSPIFIIIPLLSN